MKLFTLAFIALLISQTMVGCADPNKDVDEMLKKLDQDLKKQMEEIDASKVFYVGGQPGAITVSGVAIKKDKDKMILDERIKVEQSVGESYIKQDDTNLLIEKANQAVFLETIPKDDLKPLEQRSVSKEFVNIGCNQFDKSLVEGLSEVKITEHTKEIASVLAKTIIICGKVDLPYSFISFSAENIILIDVDYSITSLQGFIDLQAANLTVTGKNKISTRGKNATHSLVSAPTINLAVAKTISGEGNLTLFSVGGECVKGEDKKPIDKK